ncbi:hypothetical protein IW261DRAFT_1419776 [Armillaria novae-zelandiae]|uniref:Uncharacterized protein n=1 Tax=Armillaria novae-zelandiae TaxID=153914 RepID=A0AA39P8S3_9AGAR|nr:hypothetical protein IW261DRAFT_1419776 [Armillaria novae-zelandiae]
MYIDACKGDPDTVYLLPKRLYIRDRKGRYLSVRSGPTRGTVTFREGDADIDSTFQAVLSGSRYGLQGSNGNYINRYYNGWISCDGPNGGACDLDENGRPICYSYIKESSRFEIVQATIKNEIFDVKYDISGAQVREAAPVIALSTSVRNDSDGSANQTLTYSYSKSKVGTWNDTVGVTLGVSMTFSAGVPVVKDTKFQVSVSASYSHQWGGQEGETETVSSSTTVTVPPKKKAQATIIIRNAQIDVGFTYKERILWTNGQSEENVKTGVYKNVDSWHVDVQLDNWEDA